MKDDVPSLRSINLHMDPGSSRNFRCRRCGRCCHGPSRKYGIKLLYQEVHEIQEHLEGLMETGKFEDFAWDYLTFFGDAKSIGDNAFLVTFRESLRDFFFSVSQTSTDKKILYVEYYVLKTYRDSGRCIFYNPLERGCLIHDVKPLTCKLYPFYAEIDLEEEEIKVGSYPQEECPGLGCDDSVSILEVGRRALSLADSLRRHYSKLAELLELKDPSKSENVKEFYVKKLKYRLASDEDMKRRLKKMSDKKRYSGVEATDLFLEEGLIRATKEYRHRLREG
jgi:Fe-S-cluster containining protein